MSRGYTAKGDPRHWKVVDGKLYLNYDAGVQKDWEKDVPGNIARGDRHWLALPQRPGSPAGSRPASTAAMADFIGRAEALDPHRPRHRAA